MNDNRSSWPSAAGGSCGCKRLNGTHVADPSPRNAASLTKASDNVPILCFSAASRRYGRRAEVQGFFTIVPKRLLIFMIFEA